MEPDNPTQDLLREFSSDTYQSSPEPQLPAGKSSVLLQDEITHHKADLKAHKKRKAANRKAREEHVARQDKYARQSTREKRPTRRASSLKQTVDVPADEEHDENGPEKAGHTLRKRNRVNYATEQIDDEVVVPNSTYSASRSAKRKLDDTTEPEDFYGPKFKRRDTSLAPDTPSSRRRNPSRKSAEIQPYREDLYDYQDNHQSPENEIQDTIEGGFSPMGSHEAANQHFQTPHYTKVNGHTQPNGPSPTSAYSDLVISPHDFRFRTDEANTSSYQGASSPIGEPIQNEVQDHLIDPSLQLHSEHVNSQLDVPLTTPTIQSVPQSTSTPPTTSSKHNDEAASAKVEAEESQEHVYLAKETSIGAAATNSEHTQQSTDGNHAQSSLHQSEKHSQLHTRSCNGHIKILSPSPDVDQLALSQVTRQSMDRDQESKIQQLPEGNFNNDSEYSLEGPTSKPPSRGSSPIQLQQVSIERADTPLPKKAPTSQRAAVTSAPRLPKPAPAPKPQPAPVGRWSHLTPYVDGEYTLYPEKKIRSDEDDASEIQSQEEKDANKDVNDVDAPGEYNFEVPDMSLDVATSALNTPTRGSPVQGTLELVSFNSPVPPGEEPEDLEASESQEPVGTVKHYKYRKLRNAEEFVSALENSDGMAIGDLMELLQAANLSMVSWQEEWTSLGKEVDDYENSSRRRAADAKYEARTRNLHQHGVNYEEPDFTVKGYKAKEKEAMSETRYLQGQDRIMAATYGFEYDPHPSKIGRQNPQTQQAGITTRGRSLRNQPKQTVKATEADGVPGKRARKPVLLFEPAMQDASRSSTPAPTRGRRRKNANADYEEGQSVFTASFNGEVLSDTEVTPAQGRRKRGPRVKAAVPSAVEGFALNGAQQESATQEPSAKPVGRRGRPKATAPRVDEADSIQPSVEDELKPEPKRRLLTLKIPKSKNVSEQSSAISDNGESRPSTANSDMTSNTVESSYSFRPKRQKRFRDEPEDSEGTVQAPPRKRNKKTAPSQELGEAIITEAGSVPPEPAMGNGRKVPKIKVLRHPPPPIESRTGTPFSQNTTEGGDGELKEYRAMTKSEKMSASMKSKFPVTQNSFLYLTLTCSRSLGKRQHGWSSREAQGNTGSEEGSPSGR